jgi:hypothetical protein
MICGIEWRPDGNGSINIAKARISYLDGNSCEALDNTRHALDLAIEGNYTNEIRCTRENIKNIENIITSQIS